MVEIRKHIFYILIMCWWWCHRLCCGVVWCGAVWCGKASWGAAWCHCNTNNITEPLWNGYLFLNNSKNISKYKVFHFDHITIINIFNSCFLFSLYKNNFSVLSWNGILFLQGLKLTSIPRSDFLLLLLKSWSKSDRHRSYFLSLEPDICLDWVAKLCS